MAQLEAICEAMYSSPDPVKRSASEQMLRGFGTEPDAHIPQCQSILDCSQNPFAQHFAAATLTKLLTVRARPLSRSYASVFAIATPIPPLHLRCAAVGMFPICALVVASHGCPVSAPMALAQDHALTPALRVSIRNYVLNFLAARSEQLQNFVTNQLILARRPCRRGASNLNGAPPGGLGQEAEPLALPQLLVRATKVGWFDADRSQARMLLAAARPAAWSQGLGLSARRRRRATSWRM